MNEIETDFSHPCHHQALISPGGARVQLFVNCFERDYKEVLAPGFMHHKAAQFCHPFARRVVTLNNIKNMERARLMAREAVWRGEIDAFLDVSACLPGALAVCGLALSDLGAVKHYIDFALVAVTQAAPDFLLYCCAEVELLEPSDWISTALNKLQDNPDYFVANPSWASDPEGSQRESISRDGDHWVGNGFSDQCFLADARRLARPIYRRHHPSGARYPLSDLGDIFEKRVDAYMRTEGLLRLTNANARYLHRGSEGQGYPKKPLRHRLACAFKRVLGQALEGTLAPTGLEAISKEQIR
jgi:hypothetical protein